MPRPSRSRPRPTRSPETYTFHGFVIEAYNHVDDLPVLSSVPKKRPRHATRGAAAAERRADLAAATAAATGSSASPSSTPSPVHESPAPSIKPVSRRGSRSNLRSAGAPEPIVAKIPTRIRRPSTSSPQPCHVCLRKGSPWMILRCIQCAHSVHSYCLNPPRADLPNGGIWACATCTATPVPEKTRFVRSFRHAVEKYPFMLDHRYLDSMTSTVELAAASAIPTRPSPQSTAALDLSTALDEKVVATEHTVILKVSGTDSELEDLRPERILPERMAVARHTCLDQATKRAATVPGESRKHNSKKRYADSASKASSRPRDDADVRSPWRAKKKMRHVAPPNATSSAADVARTSVAGDDTVLILSANPTASATPSVGADASKTQSPAPHSILRNSKSAKPSRMVTEKRLDPKRNRPVLLRLRRRPPTPTPRESGQKAGNQNKESTASMEMRRRLAKARAKKAEIRKAKKEYQAEQQAAALAAAAAGTLRGEVAMGRGGAIRPRLPATMAPPPVSRVGQQSRVIPVSRGRLVPFTSAQNMKDNAMYSNLNDKTEKPGKEMKPIGRPKVGLSPRGQEGKGSVPANKLDADSMSGELPGRSNGGSQNAKTVRSVEKVRDLGNPRLLIRVPKPEIIVLDVEEDTLPSRVGDAKEAANTSTTIAKRDHGAVRIEKLIDGPADQQQNQLIPAKMPPSTAATNEYGTQFHGGPRCTPEQRTAAKMATLFQPPARAGEGNARPEAKKWGGMQMDPKNDALLTLAKEQKGSSGKRKPSPGMPVGIGDTDRSLRNINALPRTDNVPESERKRMQVTALAVSSRARGTSITTASASPGTPARKSSISRLLIEPSYTATPQMTKITAEPVNDVRGQQLNFPKSSSGRLSDAEGSSMQRSPKAGADIDSTLRNQLQSRDNGNFKLLSHAGPSSKSASAAAPLPDVARIVAPSPGQSSSQGGVQRETLSSRSADACRNVVGSGGRLSSSHSGSQSEPGSTTAKGTAMLTLKKPKRKTMLAMTGSVQHSHVGTRAAEEGLLSNSLSGKTYSLSGDDYALRPNFSLKAVSDRTAPLHGNVLGDARFSYGHDNHTRDFSSNPVMATPLPNTSVVPTTSPHYLEPQLDSRSLTNAPVDHAMRRVYDSQAPREMALPASGSGQSLNARGAGQYFSEPLEANLHRSHSLRCRNDEQLSKVHCPTDVPKARVGTFGAMPALGGGLTPELQGVPEFDDRQHSERRLRRSQAPTPTTAARRAQYEQGRAMAMCTRASSASEHQHAYSSARRSRGTHPGYPEASFVSRDRGPDWVIPSVEIPSSMSRHSTPFASYNPSGAVYNPVLKHEAISRDVARSHVPVVYDSQHSRNQRPGDLGYSSESIPRLQGSQTQTGAARASENHGPGRGHGFTSFLHQPKVPYRDEIFTKQADLNVPSIGEHFQPIPPPRFATRQEPCQGPTSQGLQQTPHPTSGLWRGNAIDPESVRGPTGPVLSSYRKPKGQASMHYSPSSVPTNAVADTTPEADEQQSQPVRTDPSLKNLLS